MIRRIHPAMSDYPEAGGFVYARRKSASTYTELAGWLSIDRLRLDAYARGGREGRREGEKEGRVR